MLAGGCAQPAVVPAASPGFPRADGVRFLLSRVLTVFCKSRLRSAPLLEPACWRGARAAGCLP